MAKFQLSNSDELKLYINVVKGKAGVTDLESFEEASDRLDELKIKHRTFAYIKDDVTKYGIELII